MPKNLISNVEVKVQPKSGFDKSFKNILTTKVGTLTPLVSKLLIPNSDFNMSLAISASLPPLASDTFMRCSLKVEGFVVPMRLLFGGFESWLTGAPLYKSDGTQVRSEIPIIQFAASEIQGGSFGAGTLQDYLGAGYDDLAGSSGEVYGLNIFKHLAYHRVYHDWYRNRKVQKPVFVAPVTTVEGTTNSDYLRQLPYRSFVSIRPFSLTNTFADGVSLGSLRQRNFGDDYFTVATPNAQDGSAQKVTIDANDQFTIAALRSANSLQQFSERNNLASPQLQDYCRVNYGAHLSSGVAQRSILLGSAEFPVYTKGVEAQSDVTATSNPFTSVGARYGQAYAAGSNFVLKGHVDEPAYLLVLVSLVPEANYSSSVDKHMLDFCSSGAQVDLPNPLLENVGNEAISQEELVADPDFRSSVFGYVPRYTRHKTGVNQVHGLLRDRESLESFVAQRSFTSGVVISSSFLQIPTTYLDQVTAVNADVSQYGCWIDSSIKLFVSEPLRESALPSLQNPAEEHGKTEIIQRNGSKL